MKYQTTEALLYQAKKQISRLKGQNTRLKNRAKAQKQISNALEERFWDERRLSDEQKLTINNLKRELEKSKSQESTIKAAYEKDSEQIKKLNEEKSDLHDVIMNANEELYEIRLAFRKFVKMFRSGEFDV